MIVMGMRDENSRRLRQRFRGQWKMSLQEKNPLTQNRIGQEGKISRPNESGRVTYESDLR